MGRSVSATLMVHWKLVAAFCFIFNCSSGWKAESINVQITEGHARMVAWMELATYVPAVFVEGK